MAKMKTIGIEAKLDEKFKIEVKAGDHIMYVDQTKADGGTDAGPTPLEYFFRVSCRLHRHSIKNHRQSEENQVERHGHKS